MQSAQHDQSCLAISRIRCTHPEGALAAALKAEAERRKRAQVLESEGDKQALINRAEAEKSEVILRSEAAKEDSINRATGAALCLHHGMLDVARAANQAVLHVWVQHYLLARAGPCLQ